MALKPLENKVTKTRVYRESIRRKILKIEKEKVEIEKKIDSCDSMGEKILLKERLGECDYEIDSMIHSLINTPLGNYNEYEEDTYLKKLSDDEFNSILTSINHNQKR